MAVTSESTTSEGGYAWAAQIRSLTAGLLHVVDVKLGAKRLLLRHGAQCNAGGPPAQAGGSPRTRRGIRRRHGASLRAHLAGPLSRGRQRPAESARPQGKPLRRGRRCALLPHGGPWRRAAAACLALWLLLSQPARLTPALVGDLCQRLLQALWQSGPS